MSERCIKVWKINIKKRCRNVKKNKWSRSIKRKNEINKERGERIYKGKKINVWEKKYKNMRWIWEREIINYENNDEERKNKGIEKIWKMMDGNKK